MLRRNIINNMRLDLPPVFTSDDGRAWLSDHYQAPEKALNAMVERGEVVRLKRGIYAFRMGFDPLSAASVLCPPSYVSFEAALAYYGLIPERVETVMAVVDGRSACFDTPLGRFEFHSQRRELYALGMTIAFNDQHVPVPIATREKAVLDALGRAKLRAAAMSLAEVRAFMTQGLRIDDGDLRALSLRKLGRMAELYRNHGPRKLVQALSTASERCHA